MDLAAEKQIKKRKCEGEKEEEDDDDQPPRGMENLPPDIAAEILSSLPITSLIKFRFVSRACNTLSRKPNLVQLQFSRSANEYPCLILHCDYPIRNQLYFVELFGHQENGIVRKLHVPFYDMMPEFNVIASCNGLLCISDSLYSDSVHVCNPFTRECKELPKSTKFEDQEVVFGFGFHPTTNEYKVIKIAYYWDGCKKHSPYSRLRAEVQVHTLGTNTWRRTGEPPYQLELRSSEALVNGRLHWLTRAHGYQGVFGRSIVSFDLEDERFKMIPKPDCGGLDRTDYHLAVLGGCLAAAVTYNYDKFEIWVMKEYDVRESWIKEFVIGGYTPRLWIPELQRSSAVWRKVLNGRNARVVGLMKNGNVLVEYKEGALVSFDPDNRTFKKVMFQGMPGLFRTFVHVGCLNSVDSPIHVNTK